MNLKWHEAYNKINKLKSTHYMLTEVMVSAEIAGRSDVLEAVKPIHDKIEAEWDQAHADLRAAQKGGED